MQGRSPFFMWLVGLTAGVAGVAVGVALGLGVSRLTDAETVAVRGGDDPMSTDATPEPGEIGSQRADSSDVVGMDQPLPFVVAWGFDGTVVTDGERVTQLSNEPFEQMRSGPFGVQLDDDHAVVLTPNQLHLLDRNGTTTSADCVGCSGVAIAGDEIVTAHGTTDDESVAVEVFDDRLVPLRTIATTKLGGPGPVTGGAIQTPTVLAASEGRFTISYLGADAIEEGGPSIVAQYSAEGEPLGHVVVEGTVGQASVSPDGRMLGISVTRGYDACDPPSRPVLLRLDDLEEVDLGEAVPPELGDVDLSFRTTDLYWDGAVMTATGQVSRGIPESADDDPCDAHPGLWSVHHDAATEETAYSPSGPLLAKRMLRPDCKVSVSIHATLNQQTLVGSEEDEMTGLGEFRELALGSAPSACAVQLDARPAGWPGSAATDIYFVGQLYDGSLSLPGSADASDTAVSSPLTKPEAMKLGSGVMWNLGTWTGWGTTEAIATGTFTDHTEFESDGSVTLSRPRMCGSSLMYSRIEQRWDQPMPEEIASYTPATIDIEGCE